MKVHTNLSALPKFKNAVITIGSYDGVHAGHQAIIQYINRLAQSIGGESVLITFHPHPRLVVRPDDNSLRLINTIDEKVKLLERYGINHVVIVPFTKEFSQQTPMEYVEEFLVKKFQPQKIVIGYDHKFGNKRAGNIGMLKTCESQFGFQVMEIEEQEVDTIVVSSTKIRNALLKGEVKQAKEWLGHCFMLSGEVIHGQHLGTEIGYPTANIQIKEKHKLIPPEGIYAVKVRYESQVFGGMLYIGRRPTLNGILQSIEVNIFDFQKNIYGQHLEIDFIQHIREDKKFDDLNGLKIQLALDKIETMKILSNK